MDESLRIQEPLTAPADVEESWLGHSLRHTVESTRQLVLAHQAEAVTVCLLILLAVNLLTAISRKTITNDEIVHIPAGYYHLVMGDFQFNNEHPPLVKMWAALPLLFIQPEEPQTPYDPDANFAQKSWASHHEFWNANRDRFLTISFWPRVMMVPVTLALGIMIFLFARRLFGPRAAVLAVALFTLEPTILAHGRIVHTDVASALVFLAFFFTLYCYSKNDGWRNAITLAVVTGVALLTKFSMLVLGPVLLCYLAMQIWTSWKNSKSRRSKLLQTIVISLIVLFLINAAYYFQRPPLNASDEQWIESNSGASAESFSIGIRALSNIVPTYFLFGAYNVAMHNKSGHPTSLLGNYSDRGWWYYFPVAFALKTTLPFLFLAIASLLWALWQLGRRSQFRFLWLIVPLIIYSALSLTGHINIGIRHFLPAFPLLFILSGALLDRVLRARRRVPGIAVVAILFLWMIVEVVRVFPDYTPYMNQLASGGPPWSYLSDSNVEWGDDVGALADYLKARGETKVRAALSGGWDTLPKCGVEFVNLMPLATNAPDTRYVAIGASYLNGSTVPYFEIDHSPMTPERRINYFDDYRHRTPEAVFGGSIYLFREHE